MKKILFIIVITAFVSSCSQPEVGYISDNIHSLQDTINVPRGTFYSTPPPAIEGSTYPLEWSITGITDQDGNPTTELQDKFGISIWKAPFDPNTDTTLELANKKIEFSEEPIIIMNAVSGQFVFTQASQYASGNDYDISVKAKNIKGEKLLDKFSHIKLDPFIPIEFIGTTKSKFDVLDANGDAKELFASFVDSDGDPRIASVLDGTHPYFTVLKVSDEPKLGIKVKMIIADSYGNILNPTKVIPWPNPSSPSGHLQNFNDNTIGTVVDAEGTTFGLPAPPFPQYAPDFGGYNMYYRTASNAFVVDKEAYESDRGPIDWAPYTDANGVIRNRPYIRWTIKVNDTGTWEIRMKIPYTKIKE